MAFDEVCPERLLDALFDWEDPQLERTDQGSIPPGEHRRLVALVMDPQNLGYVKDCPSSTLKLKWNNCHYVLFGFLCLGARLDVPIDGCHEESCLAFSYFRLPVQPTQANGELVPIPVPRFLREVTEEVFTEANDDVILEAFHTVKPSSLTPTPREFINFVE